MKKSLISKNWFFSEDGKNYSKIDLPHDYQIAKPRTPDGEECTAYFVDGRGFYIKHLTLDKNKHYTLHLDGAYMCAQIFLNENHIALHPHGYAPFLCDLTPYMIEGTNKLKIITAPIPGSSRWYSGNGIYRDVFLWEGGDVRIEPWDTFVFTQKIDENSAKVCTRFTVTSNKKCRARVHLSFIAPDGTIAHEGDVHISVGKGKKVDAEYVADIADPLLWDVDTPNLYTLKTDIYSGDALCDTAENTFGIRTVVADAKKGLLINGKSVKLRGGCIHHDHGALGAIALPAAEERKLTILKKAGFNAIRCAHNPPSLALLECCDRLGIFVMDEAFDMWNKFKRPYDYHIFFDDWCLRDVSYMVKRERNHPSVISYSIGNEIFEIDCSSDSARHSAELCAEIRKHDDTKLVTSGIYKGFVARSQPDSFDPEDYRDYLKKRFHSNDQREIAKLTRQYEEPLDIVGYNYSFVNMDIAHECYPDKLIWRSESQALKFFDCWKQVTDNDFVIGDFTWTAIDNLGEVGAGSSSWARDGVVIYGTTKSPYPWRTCYQGDHDLCGYRRPQSYLREAVWVGNKEPRIFVTHPEHFGESFTGTGWHWYDVDECWTFEDKYVGRPITVETYTDADEIAWLINDREVGRCTPEKAIARFNTVYEKGDITAVAYKDGKETSRYTLSTTGEACAINVAPERNEFRADRRDLCYFDISIVDKDGNLVNSAQNELTCSVQGGELMCIFSGDPKNEDQFGTNKCHAFKGRALAVVRAAKPANVNIVVYSDSLAQGHAKATAK